MEIVAQIEGYRPEVFELLANDIEKEFEILLVKQKQEKNIQRSSRASSNIVVLVLCTI